MELINAKGMRVCSERTDREEREERGYRPLVEESKNPPHNQEHLNLLRRLNSQSVETLCIDGCAQQGGVAVKFLKEALGFRNVRTLILSHGAVELCLSALNEDSDPSDHHRWLFLIHALVIHHSAPYFMHENVLKKLLSIVQKRKVAGFPFQSISMFLEGGQRWGWDEVLEELRRYVGELDVVMGDNIFDWDVDEYFLDGLDHLQKNLDVQWD